MTDDTDLGQTLSHDLAAAADRIEVPRRDAAELVGRATARTRRARLVGAVAAAALLVSTGGVLTLRAGSGGGETPVASGALTSRGSLGLSWQRVDPTSSLGMSVSVSSGTPLYALSTAPGERFTDKRPLTRVVWRSDDGVEWTAASTLGDDLYLADLATTAERIYAVGTAPGTARVSGARPASELVVGWSDDGAEHWQKRTLPLDWMALSTGATTRVTQTAIATGPRGTLAVAMLSAQLDVPALLPANVRIGEGWTTTDDAVVVLGDARDDACPAGQKPQKPGDAATGPYELGPTWCGDGNGPAPSMVLPQDAYEVVATIPFADLGVRGDLLTAVRRQPVAFFAAEGSTDFERVQLPEIDGAGVGVLSVVGGDEGFSVVTTAGGDRFGAEPGRLVVLRSGDGRSWTSEATPAAGQWVADAGHLAGSTAFVSSGEGSGSLVIRSGDTWVETPLATLLDPAWLAGRELHAGGAAFGPFGVAIHVVGLPSEKDDRGERAVDQRVLFSRDGRTWDELSVEELAGVAGALVTRLSIVGDEVVVAVALPPRDGNANSTEPRPQAVFVGRAA